MCYMADMSAVSHSRHVCCVTQQTCLRRHTADMSAVSHSRHVCWVTQQTCLLCHTANMSAMSHSRHVCCVTQQICLLCRTTDMPAVSHSRHVGNRVAGPLQTTSLVRASHPQSLQDMHCFPKLHCHIPKSDRRPQPPPELPVVA